MSSGFNTIRKHSSDPHALRFKELAAELAKSKNSASAKDLQSDDVRSQGRMDHSTIKLNDERLKFVFPINASYDNYFEFCTEPDFNFLKLWFMLDHLGTKIRDMSGFQHDGILFGHPTLQRAPLNLGYLQTSASFGFPAMTFNTALDTVGNYTGEMIKVLDHADLKFTNYAAGFSICFRFNCADFTQEVTGHDGTFNRRFASKVEDANNHWVILISTGGVIVVQVTQGGVTYQRKASGILLNAWYQVMVTYNPLAGATSADRIKIYVGGSEISASESIFLIPAPAIEKDLYIGARYAHNGFFRGFIQDFRMYMGKVLTSTEVTNLNNNEITIDSIAKGDIFVIQYALVFQLLALKTHKYNNIGQLFGFVITRTHKYNTLKAIGATLKTHRYQSVSDHTHKYHVLGLVEVTKTHKYDTLAAIATTTKTHKFNTFIEISVATKTHKFTTVAAANTTKTHKYNVDSVAGSPVAVFYQHYEG